MPGILTVTPICFVATWERRCLSEGYLSALYRLKPIRQRISFSQNITRACFFLSWGAAFLRAFHVKSSSNRILTRRELPILFSTLSLCLTLTGTGKKETLFSGEQCLTVVCIHNPSAALCCWPPELCSRFRHSWQMSVISEQCLHHFYCPEELQVTLLKVNVSRETQRHTCHHLRSLVCVIHWVSWSYDCVVASVVSTLPFVSRTSHVTAL